MAGDKSNVHLKNIIYRTKLGSVSCCGVLLKYKNVGHIKQNKRKSKTKTNFIFLLVFFLVALIPETPDVSLAAAVTIQG